jgi:hypothetical protein
VRLLCKLESTQTTAGTWAAAPTVKPVPLKFTSKSWRVDANISGTNPSLGTSSQATYVTVPGNTGLTLANNSCSTANTQCLTAWITCATTTPAEGTTCNTAAVAEGTGISFIVPEPGDIKICASFSHELDYGSSGGAGALDSTFEIVSTANNSQTIVDEGRERIDSYGEMIASGGNRQLMGQPVKVCGTFTVATTGRKTFRLFYEQLVSGTVGGSNIYTDASSSRGQRDLHWEAFPLNQALVP